jgi:hypothetical protein
VCVCYMWGAMVQSFKSLPWSNIVAAFAGDSTAALSAAMITMSLVLGLRRVVLRLNCD